MKIDALLGQKMLFLDGGFGTQLQARGLAAGELPELWNFTHPQEVTAIHRDYLEAGCHIVLSNTFGANTLKYHSPPYTTQAVVEAGVALAKAAAQAFSTPENPRFAGLDVGPTGKLLKPMGDLDFEDCVALYAEVVQAGVWAGADVIVIETMSDTLELKAAVLAAKENSSLPIIATVVLDEQGKLLTGGDAETVVALLEGLRVDVLGLNCGLGPVQLLPLVQQLASFSSLPLAISPNAGLPQRRDGKTVFDITPQQFVSAMKEIVQAGAWVVGGCCGTTPQHMALLVEACRDMKPLPITPKAATVVCSYGSAQRLGEGPVIIGERINPTGKKRFKQALVEQDMDYILGEGIRQQQSGAHILDVNVGLPEIDEAKLLCQVVTQLQGVTQLPLQLDTASPGALAAALRRYNGKALVNSVNGKAESMAQVFPLVQKYGGVVVGLALDEEGIPPTAAGRLAVAEKIVQTAAAYGIAKKDIIIDVLTMTVSAQPDSPQVTLDALALVKRELGVATVLGVSNISFGLPRRELINAAFFTMALRQGLDAAILNPGSAEMMGAYRSARALLGLDASCLDYIAAYSAPIGETPAAARAEAAMSLGQAVERGLKETAQTAAAQLLAEGLPPLEVIATQLIPALDRVGKGFEQKTIFLPQLLMSAEAAKAAFAVISETMQRLGQQREKGEKIVLATVQGDIHDIGKNIVKVLLENYGYQVVDLGKDVPPQEICRVVAEQQVRLVGLSALMTTTVESMGRTVALLAEAAPYCRVAVGGAVLNPDYASSIGAHFYGADAMSMVGYAKKVFGQG